MSGDITPYTSLITSEHDKRPNFMAAVAAVIQPLADQIAVSKSIPLLYDLDTAVGTQLDAVGQWVGISRYLNVAIADVYFSFDIAGLGFDQGVWAPNDSVTTLTALPDDEYRLLLYAKVAENSWDGTVPGALRALNNFWNAFGYTISIIDGMDMTMSYFLVGPALIPITAALYNGGYLDLRPAGVLIANHYFSTPGTPIFGFDIETSLISGFDVGYWAGSGGGGPTFNNASSLLQGHGIVQTFNTDPTIALFHFDTTIGSGGTAYTPDERATAGYFMNVSTGATIDTSVYEFGPGSLMVPYGSYATYSISGGGTGPMDPKFNFGTGDFTIEMWIKPNVPTSAFGGLIRFTNHSLSYPDLSILLDGSVSGGGAGLFGTLTDVGGTANPNFGNTTTTDVVYGVWSAIAITRQSGVVRTFVNGILQTTTSGQTANLDWSASTSTNDIRIGLYASGPSAPYEGHIDELRISNTCLYTSNYTPAVGPFV